MDKQQAAFDILTHALPLVPFEGWNQLMLGKAAVAAGYKKTDVVRVFPGGTIDAVDTFFRTSDDAMLEVLGGYSLDTMKIRERIATCVRVKLSVFAPHREALRAALAIHALPFNLHRGLRSLYATVDTIWYAAGDTSTDFNFYSKRAILAGVYSSTLMYWLNDSSPDYMLTWDFLARRIENVMQFEKVKQKLRTVIPA